MHSTQIYVFVVGFDARFVFKPFLFCDRKFNASTMTMSYENMLVVVCFFFKPYLPCNCEERQLSTITYFVTHGSDSK